MQSPQSGARFAAVNTVPSPSVSLPVDSVNLPFLGARTDTHSLFQYVLTGVSGDEVTFAVPGWVALREHLEAGAGVSFHLPFATRADFFDEGEVTGARADAEQGGQVAVARLTARSPLQYPLQAAVADGRIRFGEADDGPVERLVLAQALLRDCALTKQGVRVYFKHLVPLFSRITLFPTEEYARLRTVLLEEIRGKIIANVAALETWTAEAQTFAPGDLAGRLDMEALRAAIEPEINNELFGTVFDLAAVKQYLDAIRLLERKLCLNYNTLVLLYAAALQE